MYIETNQSERYVLEIEADGQKQRGVALSGDCVHVGAFAKGILDHKELKRYNEIFTHITIKGDKP